MAGGTRACPIASPLRSRHARRTARPWQPISVDPGTTVYHYTAPAGLLGILEDRTLWATEVKGLNDTGAQEAQDQLER